MIKLGKALYYRHNSKVFEGVIYAIHMNSLARDDTPEAFQEMLRMAPGLSEAKRAHTPLQDQFIYRFNHSAADGVRYAVAQFSEQFIFQLIVIGWDMANRLAEMAKESGTDISDINRHELHLEHAAAQESEISTP